LSTSGVNFVHLSNQAAERIGLAFFRLGTWKPRGKRTENKKEDAPCKKEENVVHILLKYETQKWWEQYLDNKWL